MKGIQGLLGWPDPAVWGRTSREAKRAGRITGATVLRPSDCDRLWICSGTTADFTVVPPPAKACAGRWLSFLMDPLLTKLVAIQGYNGTEYIGTETSLVLWANESIDLVSDGSDWVLLTQRFIPMQARVRETANSTLTSGLVSLPTYDVADYDIGGLFNAGTYEFVLRRTGRYVMDGMISQNNGADGSIVLLIWYRNGGEYLRCCRYTIGGNDVPNTPGSMILYGAAGDSVSLRLFQNGSATSTDGSGNVAFAAWMAICECLR